MIPVTVVPGDTLSRIAAEHHITWQALWKANPKISNPNLIYVGEVIEVPVTGIAPVPVTVIRAAPVTSGSDNYLTIAKFLVAHGYSRSAAAGVVACIAGESAGNPESVGMGGGGLIGWTPLPPGLVTGNPTADLNAQLERLLAYNDANGSVPTLNIIPGAVAAADYYSQHFERPAVTNSDVRVNVANEVYAQL
jgi:hypothetical protein